MKLLYQSFSIINLLQKKNVPIGGAAVEWYTWLKGFYRNGNIVGILTKEGANSLVKSKDFEFDLIESYSLIKGLPKIRLLTYRLPKIYKAVKCYKPDFVIQACATENTGLIAIVAKLLSIPFIHRIGSDMDVDGRINRSISKYAMMLYNFGIRNASHISCQNKYQLEILKKKFPNKSISILYNPFEIRHNIKDNSIKEYISWIGNFRFEKNLPVLAQIASNLTHYKFKIAGTKFKITDEDTKKGLDSLEKLPNVEFIGHISNESIPEFLSKAYCLLNTSRLEGFSNTFLEAWSVGVPVITTKNVNPDNLINEYNLGIVAENYEDLPGIIDSFIKNKKYEDYEKRCKNYVQENHDPVKLAAKFLEEMKNSIKK